ncbi:carboxyl transferase domain-containing protein [Agromyces atrinae]|uniref:Acetyl-CoA carboxyl transferase n=1 Tax=Agromyces atrinae TaxID=592376 RepID=A0A4Q2M7T1_9MICO|nr:carboxyl transferase domain-containing protein [Agromyces atrinae]NYD66716.1 acetyl-CoA carboxylase carboxyl transferase subunit beta [Agromyces atrinae]RXZ87377.1 acetyl-CoA carboxyl transferase [Agromyces atrinae]
MTAPRISARELIELLADPGTFRSWDSTPRDVATDAAYAADLAAARASSGVDESVITGEGTIRGRRVALVACEFRFLAGSIGLAAANRLVAAIERATLEGLPLLAGPASGGTRMQEGTRAFVSMIAIAAAVARHKAAGLPYLVYLRHPTTGGVLASWGSLGHVTVAEPGALIGFLGPRVYEALYDEPFPSGVQTAENLFRHGLIDGVLAPRDLPGVVERVLNVLGARDAAIDPSPPEWWTGDAGPVWPSIERSRRASRPGIRTLLKHAATDVLPLNGTGQGEKDPGLVLALARFGGAACVVMGQDRQVQRRQAPLGPAALREARRGMRLSNELGLPLVSIIDTPGAALSREAEEGGLAGEIARSLAQLVMHRGVTLSVLLGEGTGGGALALLPADRTIAARHAWLSPLPPEGASAIVHRDTAHAAEMAESQGVGAADLLRDGIVDAIVPEHDDAADEPLAFSLRMGRAIEHTIGALRTQNPDARLDARLQRYRRLGR